MATYPIDEIDHKILATLVKNARTPFLEIARECGVSGAAIHQRFKKLESLGIVTGSRLLVKPSTLGLDVCAFVEINLDPVGKYHEVIDSLKKVPEVIECHFVTGRHTLLIKMYCMSHDHLLDILVNTIQNIPGVQDTETLISLDQAIERQVQVKATSTTKGYHKKAKAPKRK